MRQLRYSGLMETAKIRHAGYPIRHTFVEFVDRYRFIVAGIQPSHKTNCKAASEKMCEAIFGTEQDYQIGQTKVFLKHAQDVYLEEERSKIFDKKVLVLQRNIRKWIYRRWFIKLREAAIVFQKYWRARGYQSRYRTIKCGYLRLQAKIQQRQLTCQFKKKREIIASLQKYCKGYAFRKTYKKRLELKRKKMEELLRLKQQEEAELKKKGQKDYKAISEENYRNRMSKLDERTIEDETKTEAILDELLQGLDEYLDKNEAPYSSKEKTFYEVSQMFIL